MVPFLCMEAPAGIIMRSLHWRHNERDGVSNHQPHDCLPHRLFRLRSKKTSKLRVTGLCEGNSPVTGEFPAQMASHAENVSIWWRHHDHGVSPGKCQPHTFRTNTSGIVGRIHIPDSHSRPCGLDSPFIFRKIASMCSQIYLQLPVWINKFNSLFNPGAFSTLLSWWYIMTKSSISTLSIGVEWRRLYNILISTVQVERK